MASHPSDPLRSTDMSAPATAAAVRKLRVAYQKRDANYAQLYHVTISTADSGEVFMHCLRELVFTGIIPKLGKFLKDIDIGIADVQLIQSTIPITDPRLNPLPTYVTVLNNIPDPLLTQAFNRPAMVQTGVFGLGPGLTYALSSGADLRVAKSLVVRTKANRVSCTIVLVAILALACMVGVIVGVATRRSEMGLGAATAMLGVLAVIPGVLVFF